MRICAEPKKSLFEFSCVPALASHSCLALPGLFSISSASPKKAYVSWSYRARWLRSNGNIEIVQMANSNLQPADLLRASYFTVCTRTWPCSARYRQQVSVARHAFREELPLANGRREWARLRRSQGSLSLALHLEACLKVTCRNLNVHNCIAKTSRHLSHCNLSILIGSPPSAQTSFIVAPS